MRALLLISALVLPPRQAEAAPDHDALAARVSVRADSDSVLAVGILKDLAAAFAEVARRNGYDLDATIDGWLEPSYIAAASTRPDIAEYFMHREAYAADLATHMDSIATTVVQRRLDAAGYPVMEKDGMRDAFLRGFHKSEDKQRMVLESMRRQARIALRVHDFLVKVDERVSLDAKGAYVFKRPADKARWNELAVAIDAANDQVAQATGTGAGGGAR